MSFTCKNFLMSLTAGQTAPVKKSKPASIAAVLLCTVIGIIGLASTGCGNQSSPPPVQATQPPKVAQVDPAQSPASSTAGSTAPAASGNLVGSWASDITLIDLSDKNTIFLYNSRHETSFSLPDGKRG